MKKENEFTLDKHSYLCAYHFAMQYKELKEELEDLSAAYTKQSYDNTPIRSGHISNKTEALAIQRHITKLKIEKIEKAAYETDPNLYEWILIGVTTGATYNHLNMVLGMPCSRNTYYSRRKQFYYVLSRKLRL